MLKKERCCPIGAHDCNTCRVCSASYSGCKSCLTCIPCKDCYEKKCLACLNGSAKQREHDAKYGHHK